MLEMKYKNSGHKYKVEFSIVALHVLQLLGDFPIKEEGFTLSREGKEDNWDYSGYTTVYREVEGGVQFSNDGSVFVAPVQPVPAVTFLTGTGGSLNGNQTQNVNNYNELVIPTPVPDENYVFSGWVPEIPTEGAVEENAWFQAAFSYVPTLEEVKERKKQEIYAAYNADVAAGVDVELSTGTQHFPLQGEDREFLMGKQLELSGTSTELVSYQDSDNHCMLILRDDMQKIITKALTFVNVKTTYRNNLCEWVDQCETKEEVAQIIYGVSIPEEYQNVVYKMYLAQQQEG